jgi:hypothetical protein
MNMVGLPVCDIATGGGMDGLHSKRVNENQGAESTLSYLSSLVDLRDITYPTAPSFQAGIRDIK